jgi:hypothetical protein
MKKSGALTEKIYSYKIRFYPHIQHGASSASVIAPATIKRKEMPEGGLSF